MTESPCDLANSTLDSIELYASLAFAIVSTTLYGWLIFRIVKYKEFHHPFYYQFIFLAINNVILWCSIYFIHRVIPSPWICPLFFPRFSTAAPYFAPFPIAYFMCIAAQLLVIMLISANRMSCVVWPLHTEKFWYKRNHYFLLAIVCLTILYGSLFFNISPSVDFLATRITLRFQLNWPYVNPALSTAIFAVVCLVTICISTAVTLIRLKSTKMRIKAAEVNMFWTSVGFSVSTMFILVFMILFYTLYVLKLKDGELLWTVFDLRGVVFDINCMAPAWLVYFTNRRIRRASAPPSRTVSMVEAPSGTIFKMVNK